MKTCRLVCLFLALAGLTLVQANADTAYRKMGNHADAAGMKQMENQMSDGKEGHMHMHMHGKGGWMLSYRYMHMFMEGNRAGSSSISRDTIATTVPNPFFGRPMQPRYLRVVPSRMRMEMHMFGLMYSQTDWLTWMLMTSYIKKDMDLVSYMGPMGTDVRGGFTTRAHGVGDTNIGARFRLHRGDDYQVYAKAGISVPTGSVGKKDRVLAPTGATPRLRLPYPMQLGSGTFDFLPELAFMGRYGAMKWGARYNGVIRLESENYRGYRLGNVHRITAWGDYPLAPWVRAAAQLSAETTGRIHGQDPGIVAPVQTANPDNYGGERVNLLLGLNFPGRGRMQGHRIKLEAGAPIYQHVNGIQLERDWMFRFVYQLMP